MRELDQIANSEKRIRTCFINSGFTSVLLSHLSLLLRLHLVALGLGLLDLLVVIKDKIAFDG